MPFHHHNRIRYYTFDLLTLAGFEHAIFTRQGGISPNPWTSLNLGGTVGDLASRVVHNRLSAFRALNRRPESIYDVWQVHSSEVVCTDAPRLSDQDHKKADAILTDTPEVTLFMRFADCVPILLADPVRGVVGLVHAGWKGTTGRIAAAAVEKMQSHYGSNPADLLAGVGPSIGAHHYPVGQDVVAEVVHTFGRLAEKFLSNHGESSGLTARRQVKFDLWAANQAILEQCGVGAIEVAGICTACHLDDWYSHRAEQGKTGRFGAMIGLGL
jgi:YfiH family protein